MTEHRLGLNLLLLFLCSSQHFHEAAYMADDRQDLLNAINEFLDCSIVIPPSEVEGKDLLKSIATFQKLLLRKRKEREQKSMKEGDVQEAKGLSTHIWAKEFVPSALRAPVGLPLTEPGRGVSRAWLQQWAVVVGGRRQGYNGGRTEAVSSWGHPEAVGCAVMGGQISMARGKSPWGMQKGSPRGALNSLAQALPSMHLQSCVK